MLWKYKILCNNEYYDNEIGICLGDAFVSKQEMLSQVNRSAQNYNSLTYKKNKIYITLHFVLHHQIIYSFNLFCNTKVKDDTCM